MIPIRNPRYNSKAGTARPASTNAVQGWEPNKDSELELTSDGLKIESIGKDPFIVHRELTKAKGPYKVQLTMRSNSKGNAQVFWTTEQNSNFHRDRSVVFSPTADNQWHDYVVELPANEAITALRVDPSNQPGTIFIRVVAIKDGTDREVAAWNFAKTQ